MRTVLANVKHIRQSGLKEARKALTMFPGLETSLCIVEMTQVGSRDDDKLDLVITGDLFQIVDDL